MAKKKALPKKKLMPAKEVTVKSLAYGEHKRAARGSKTPVGLNEAFALHNAKTVAVSSTAKRVHDLLKHCGKHFKEAMLWQVMLSRMRKAASDNRLTLLETLKGMDLNNRYPLGRMAHPFVKLVVWDKNTCTVKIHGGLVHVKHGDTEYYYEVFLLTLGQEAEEDRLANEKSRWIGKHEQEMELPFVFVVPAEVRYYLVCVHLMTGKNGKETGTLASRGMKIVGVGKRNDEQGI